MIPKSQRNTKTSPTYNMARLATVTLAQSFTRLLISLAELTIRLIYNSQFWFLTFLVKYLLVQSMN